VGQCLLSTQRRRRLTTRCGSKQPLEEFAVDDRGRDDAGGPDGGEGLLEAERFAGRFGLVAGARDHFIELRLADDVARTVAGLAQIQELFEADQLALRVGPAARNSQDRLGTMGCARGTTAVSCRDGETEFEETSRSSKGLCVSPRRVRPAADTRFFPTVEVGLDSSGGFAADSSIAGGGGAIR
jgi:hypothetical protein